MAEIGVRHDSIAELLLTERFLWRAIGLSDSELRDLITDLCRETRLGVVVIHVETSGSKRGSHRMVWQSFSGDHFEDQWFTVPTAEGALAQRALAVSGRECSEDTNDTRLPARLPDADDQLARARPWQAQLPHRL